MKRLSCLGALLFAVLVVKSEEIHSRPRVVRMMAEDGSGKWRMSINGREPSVLSSMQMTNRLVSLKLKHGDIIILGNKPDRNSRTFGKVWAWLAAYHDPDNIAVYMYGADDTFTIPVYHAVAPFNNPMKLEEASFFREGELIGHGKEGLQKTFDSVRSTRPKRILLLCSAYNMTGGLGMGASPYKCEPRRWEILEEIGTRWDVFDAIDGW